MQVQIDNYQFPVTPLGDNKVFSLTQLKLSKDQKIKLLSRMLLKSYSPDYMTYLINTPLPLFLIKPEFVKENL